MICKPYCFEFIKTNKVPPYSVMNNMYLETSPCELKVLNFYERLLIQKAKCFQTIVQLKPYQRIFSHLTCPALKGNQSQNEYDYISYYFIIKYEISFKL